MQFQFPDGWLIQRDSEDIMTVTHPDGSFFRFLRAHPGQQPDMGKIGNLLFAFFDAMLRETAAMEVARKTSAAWGDGVYVGPAVAPDLKTFLDHAAGEGYEFNGVDAQRLYLDIFGVPT